MRSVTTIFQLTSREERLRRFLLDVAKFIDHNSRCSEPVVLRWAGGWVRDKLLEVESHDIDVAINIMTGQEFAHQVFEYCKLPLAISKHNISVGEIGNLHKVARNPEKSKHLETAMIKLFGLDLDFVNLRKETYADDSRNPKMEFGSAREDAFRRDATINAIFYNLDTGLLEDFTNGIRDISAKVMRTPLEPFQTFMDDPLRVLRLIRFASRLQFSIHPTTEHCMSNPDVLEALRVKISRERVGVEFEKMLRGDHPRIALQLLDRLRVFPALFNSPSQGLLPMPDISRWNVAYNCLGDLVNHQTSGSINQVLVLNDDAKYLAWNLAAMSPWLALEDHGNQSKKKANALPPVAAMAQEAFKATRKVTSVLAACHRHRKEILRLKTAVCDNAPMSHQRDVYGMAIRTWEAEGGHWRVQVLGTLLFEAMERLEKWPDKGDLERDNFILEWQGFLDQLKRLDVYNAPDLQRLLDGRALAQALGIQPGNWTGKALDMCIAWQLRHPSTKDSAGAIEEVRKRQAELGIKVE